MCGAAVLLIQALSAWHDAHMGRLPSSAEEKVQFRALLRSWQRSTDGVPMQVGVGIGFKHGHSGAAYVRCVGGRGCVLVLRSVA